MKHLSTIASFVIISVLVFIRISYLRWDTPTVTTTLTWDALGYYLYLPGQFIYHDLGQLKWFPHILEAYQPTGNVYQISALPNGNYAMKYLMGLSIMYLPFFFLGHWSAGWLGYAQDGFSAPYQLAICLAALVYALLGCWILRAVLRRFFPEIVTAITLLLVALATNYPQYVSVDSGQTHGFLFTMYAALLYATVRWHEKPSVGWAFAIGAIIGLSCITRPTEGVMLFIPLLWRIKDQAKWALWRQHRTHLFAAMLGGFLAIFPQLAYWKYVTGHWMYDVGSKWTFFRPHWQVLFGWNKGWFVYTPITLFMIAGLFFMRSHPFRKSVLFFTLMNIWIIIAWSDWRYGGSYSCRALVQSYAVLALPLAIMVEKCLYSRWKYVGLALAVFLLYLNLFQIWQYNRTIVHYYDMNRRYYQAIFLKAQPTPLDMSLLDTKERLSSENGFSRQILFASDSTVQINTDRQDRKVFFESERSTWPERRPGREQWLRITAQVNSAWGAFDSQLTTRLAAGERLKETACRLENGICEPGAWNTIDYYFYLPDDYSTGKLTVLAETKAQQDIFIRQVTVQLLSNE